LRVIQISFSTLNFPSPFLIPHPDPSDEASQFRYSQLIKGLVYDEMVALESDPQDPDEPDLFGEY
jgi:hypothetical protein